MRKKVLSLLTVLCLTISLVPAAFATDTTMNETDFRNAVAAGGTVTMTGDVTLTGTLTIGNAVTIDGTSANYAINYNGNSTSYAAIDVATDAPVVLQNLTINATETNGRAVKLSNGSSKFTFKNGTMNVGNRGIWVGDAGCDADSYITVDNSVIQNSQLPSGSSYDTWARYGDTRGISLWNMNAADVNIVDSSILGFGYTVNLTGDMDSNGIRDYNGTTVDVTNSFLKGWTTFNVWSAKTVFTITNTYLLGINNSNGGYDGFATIVVNDDLYGQGFGHSYANEFNIAGGTITNYQSGAADEQLFRVDDEGITKVNFAKNGIKKVKIIDTTGNAVAAFFSPLMTSAEMASFVTDRVTGHEYCTLTGKDGGTLVWGSVLAE